MSAPFDADAQVVEVEGYRVFGGYVEADEPGYDLMLERLLRARSQQARAALVVEAAVHGLVVEDEDGDDGPEGGEAA
jgi:hypothetical protein